MPAISKVDYDSHSPTLCLPRPGTTMLIIVAHNPRFLISCSTRWLRDQARDPSRLALALPCQHVCSCSKSLSDSPSTESFHIGGFLCLDIISPFGGQKPPISLRQLQLDNFVGSQSITILLRFLVSGFLFISFRVSITYWI